MTLHIDLDTARAHEEATALLMALDREQQGIPNQLHQAVETGDVEVILSLREHLRQFGNRLAI